MFDWLRKCFPSLGTPKVEVVLDLPHWTVADCQQLQAFIESNTGKKLISRFAHTATAMCLDPNHFDEQMSSDRRAIALFLQGLKSLADEDYWKYRDEEYLKQEFAEEFDPSMVDDEDEFPAE